MTSRDAVTRGCGETRVALGDVTNQLGKRCNSLISGDLNRNDGDKTGTECPVANLKDRGRRICVSPLPCSKKRKEDYVSVSDIWKLLSETEEPNAITRSVTEAGDDSKGTCRPVPSKLSGRDCPDIGVNCEIEEVKVSSESTDIDAHDSQNDTDNLGFDNTIVMSQSGSVDCARLPESQESGVGLERCIGSKTADGCSNLNAGVDLIESCSCTFCTKAAYILLDLHYQDIKGRIAATKKSQKEASILVERSSRSKISAKHGPGSFSKEGSKLESELMGQWRSLFLHMENIFERESSQLEASLLSLTGLRENCKTELELINDSFFENP